MRKQRENGTYEEERPERMAVCACGETMPEMHRKAEPILCYYVRCPNCGRESAKHRREADAMRDWNLDVKRARREEEAHGAES